MRKQTQFGVVVVESIDNLIVAVFEWTMGTGAHAHVCVCLCVCVFCIYSYCLLGDNSRLCSILKVLFAVMFKIKTSATVVFVIRCLYSAVSLTLGGE